MGEEEWPQARMGFAASAAIRLPVHLEESGDEGSHALSNGKDFWEPVPSNPACL